ncbi:MAG: glycosyltransferase family 4 protein [Clostridia bacterium]|nr:glycosyltransferase family 4 protein [Clostridia bacterium]
MNILYITSVFPRPEEGATIYTDLAEALTQAGHRVTALVADGDKTAAPSAFSEERGLSVLRVRTGSMYNVGLIRKGLSVLTLGRLLKKAIRRNLSDKEFDLILFETPPVSFYKTAAYAKKTFRAPVFLMLKDIFPQNGVDLGLFSKKSPVYCYFRMQEKALYRTADLIGCMSPVNMDYIRKHNAVPAEKVVLFPNTKALSPMPETPKSDIRKAFGLPEDKVIFMFGGNVGVPQSPDFIIEATRALLAQKDAYVLIVGRGTHGAYVRDALQDEPNFRMMDNLPREQYESLLSACDIGLIFLDKRFTIPNFPSRILSYMNDKLPVLAATDDVSDIKVLISDAGCGFWCTSDDAEAFAALAKRLTEDAALRKEMGNRGFRYFRENLTPKTSVSLLTQYMQKEEMKR